MLTRRLSGGTHWRHYLIGALVLASPGISGCATATPAGAAPQAASSLPGQLPALPAANLTLDQVVALARGGQKADALIARIRDAGAYYRLSAADVVALAQKGLPMPVIDHILTSERQFSAGIAATGAPASQGDRPIPVQTRPKRPIPALYLGV